MIIEEIGTVKLLDCPDCKKKTPQGVVGVMWRKHTGEEPEKVWFCAFCGSYWEIEEKLVPVIKQVSPIDNGWA